MNTKTLTSIYNASEL